MTAKADWLAGLEVGDVVNWVEMIDGLVCADVT